MKNRTRPLTLTLLAASVALAGFCGMAQRSPAQAPQSASAVYDYADEITRLVENQKIDELAHLGAPANAGAPVPQLHSWTASYVAAIQRQEAARDKEYNEAVAQGQKLLNENQYDQAMDRITTAYLITRDQAGFLKLDWVKNLTAKVAARAAELEKQGDWIESLQLYTDLNSLYEIDTRYKPDMQRLAQRTRLLAVYTPQTLVDMRNALLARQAKQAAATQPGKPAATESAEDEKNELATFTRWQDYVAGVNYQMCDDSITRAAADWVEKTSDQTLVQGGVDALRLFLTTPQLAKVFPGLADAHARDVFAKALDGAIALDASGKTLDADDIDQMLHQLVDASANSVNLPKEVVLREFTDGAMDKLDPFSAVIWPHELPEFNKETRGSFSGVGIEISLENGILKVVSPLPDTPAYRAGIEAGDVIAGIDGKSTLGISIDQAVGTIMGPAGSSVVLQIKREGQPNKDYTLTRAKVSVASIKGFRRDPQDQAKWDYMIDPVNKIGYIAITGFQENTAHELRETLLDLQKQGMRGLVLDLRFNPGGLLDQAVSMCDMFLSDGTIVSTRGRSPRVQPSLFKADKDTVIPPTMPMVVLVNRYSASASEIFSGAMKDLHRALIVGHRSFGKGCVENLIPIGGNYLDPKAFIKLTMAYYYLPNGENLHRRDGSTDWGVDPDVSIDFTPKQLQQLVEQRRDADIIHAGPATQPAAKAAATQGTFEDTQLETAELIMRLQLVQPHA